MTPTPDPSPGWIDALRGHLGLPPEPPLPACPCAACRGRRRTAEVVVAATAGGDVRIDVPAGVYTADAACELAAALVRMARRARGDT